MKKPPQPPDRRRRHLSKEDEDLWKHTAGTLQPLKRAKPRIHAAPAEAGHTPSASSSQPERQTETLPRAAAVHEPARAAPKASPVSVTKPPPLNIFDRKAARKLRGGRIEIEARVDLHGLTQNAAHTALHRFLASCHARGLRWVLVITGKGSPRRTTDDPDDDRWQGAGKGILKRSVPMWLSEPELRAIVVSYATAAIQHGGEGALYVQLRTRDRARTHD